LFELFILAEYDYFSDKVEMRSNTICSSECICSFWSICKGTALFHSPY